MVKVNRKNILAKINEIIFIKYIKKETSTTKSKLNFVVFSFLLLLNLFTIIWLLT